MTIEKDIIDWASSRPGWQQRILIQLTKGQTFDGAAISKIADELLEPGSSNPTQEANDLSLKSNAAQQVQITAIANAKGVNALVDGERLDLASTGMTIVYGDNGSGKSGYARLIKSLVSARHPSSVLPDVFTDDPEEPYAELLYTVSGVEQTQTFPGVPSPDMLKMSFYDEHCGDEYLTRQSTISYRPSALTLLDGLIEVCDLVQGELKERLRSNQLAALNLNIPPQTVAGTFIVGLTAATTDEQIEKATELAEGTNDRLAAVLAEEARLTASDAAREQRRLTSASADLAALADGIEAALKRVAAESVDQISALRVKAADARAAASLAAGETFDGEPLPGIGTATWRALYTAARNFSVTEAYHGHDFPVASEDARCVWCQQPLDEGAQDRVRRFEKFMSDTTERDAAQAEAAFAEAVRKLEHPEINTPRLVGLVVTLSAHDAKLGNATEAVLGKLESQRQLLVAHFSQGADLPATLPAVDLADKIRLLSTALKSRAEGTDVAKFQADLQAVRAEKEELRANVQLCESRELVKKEAQRLRVSARLSAAKASTDTSSITAKASQLMREYVTALILDQFTRETERLRLQRVTLQDLGGQKGRLSQKPGLLGAKHKSASARSVLSEGEQTALGLAGFFTEAKFDESKSSIIFDDPVTSLDHVRRDKVAERLAQLAQDRQVVVFTHDVNFTGELVSAAKSEHVEVTERSIERRGHEPGVCRDTFPWKAKDFGARVSFLESELAKLKKERASLTQEVYEERVASWAGHLSETWERGAISEIMNQVFDRGTSEVRVMKFRLLAKITDADDQDYQEGYDHTSKWARRHDKAPETNYVAPEPDELETELKRLRDWHKRIRSYLK